MVTPLHSIDELTAIADGSPGPARDWATARVAIVAPERFKHFPTSDLVHDVILAANPPLLHSALVHALNESQQPSSGLASAAAMLGNYGVFPDDSSELLAAIDTAIDGKGNAADLWLATAASRLGVQKPQYLAAASRAKSPDRDWILPGLVLQYADTPAARLEAAREVVGGIHTQIQQAPGPLAAILRILGCPTNFAVSRYWEPNEAAEQGATIAGGTLPTLKAPLGSRKRRAQWWVQALLEGVDKPEADLLREAVRMTRTGIWTNWAVAIAAWMRLYTPIEPIDDVLDRQAGARFDVLSQARKAVNHNKVQRILKDVRNGHLGAAILAMSIKDKRIPSAIIQHVVTLQRPSLEWEVLAASSAWSCADKIPTLLKRRDTRGLGLLLAEWAPTEEVLGALIGMKVPGDLDQKLQYGCALAAMGDTAAIPIVNALAEEEGGGGFRHAVALLRDLLGGR